MENPWIINSIYELQYFNCPSCIFKDHTKQKIINHAYEIHPESIEHLMNIDDKSLIGTYAKRKPQIFYEIIYLKIFLISFKI